MSKLTSKIKTKEHLISTDTAVNKL